MRLLICAGASGGGVYPALAVLQAVGEKADAALWIGGEGGMEAELVERAEIAFRSVPAAGVHGVGLKALPGNLLQLGRGYFAARRIVEDFRPDVMLFTGGFVAVPTALAGSRIPTLVYVPDIELGLALRMVSRLADRIAVTTEKSKAYAPKGKAVSVTGYPTRQGLAGWEKGKALEFFKLSPEMPTLLTFGGSKGARSINRALMRALPELLTEMQVIHVSGRRDWEEVEEASKNLPSELAERYRPYDYLHEEMGAALGIADLAVSRAGAATLGEFPLFGLPAVLVPYPHAWRYQKVNADHLVRQDGAVMVEDENLQEELASTVLGLMRDEERRAKMRAAMKALSKPQAAEAIAELLFELATASEPTRN